MMAATHTRKKKAMSEILTTLGKMTVFVIAVIGTR